MRQIDTAYCRPAEREHEGGRSEPGRSTTGSGYEPIETEVPAEEVTVVDPAA